MKKQYITVAHFADNRLSPLNQSTTKVVLQLFVGKFSDGTTPNYQLLYGWCIVTSRPDISDEATISTFEKVYSVNSFICEIARISIYQYLEKIIKIVNSLLAGTAFKLSASNEGINVDKIRFDFHYSTAVDGNVVIRPIIFNETSSSVSRNMFEKYSHNSPFGNTPSFTLPIISLDKLKVLQSSDGYYTDYKKILIKILDYLSKETKLLFSSTESARFGNIEFINGPCANIFEKAQVYFENISSEEELEGRKIKTSKKVKVTILPNEIISFDVILINCFSRNGGQVILDEIQEITYRPRETLVVTFNTQEPISDLVVSIWIKDGDKWQIWFKHSAVLLRNIVTRMGMVSRTGKVSSSFLDKVLAAGSHLKNDVDKAMEINKSSYQTTSIGGHKLDPWVEVDNNFNSLVKSIVPEKSEATFFPKGWNSENEEHGALAFLEWFKKVCNQANDVIIQDPYFDTIGLEFLARTSNSNTSFTVITCTQTPSNDDDKIKSKTIWEAIKSFFKIKEKEIESIPNRATRIVNLLNGLPELFSSLKLTVYDYRNKTSSNKNLLHDRYIIVYSLKSEPKGFHLSNSIQNATQNYPLLITPIPLDVLRSIEKYSVDLIEDGSQKDTLEMIPLYDYRNEMDLKQRAKSQNRDLPPDEELFSKLKAFVKNEDKPDFKSIESMISSYITDDYLKFEKFWDTFGYFLARTSSCEELLDNLKKWFPIEYSHLLSKYLQSLANENNLDKFSNDRDLGRSGYYLLFLEDFDEALEASFRAKNSFFENYGFGNYAAGYASWVLLNIDALSFVNSLTSIQIQILDEKKKENINGKPILRITAILFTDLAKSLFWHSDLNIINICLASKVVSLRTLAIASIATDAVEKKDKIIFGKVKELFGLLCFEEQINAFIALLHQSRFDRGISQDQLRKDCFSEIYELLKTKDEKIIFETIERIVSQRYFVLIEALTTNNLLIPLIDYKSLTINSVLNFWRSIFESELSDCKFISKNAGVMDIAGWSIYAAADEVDSVNFVNSLLKMSKRYFATIRKPFMSGTTDWENDYSRLLMIQTVAMIALNYLKPGEKTDELSKKLYSLVNEIKLIKINYPFFRDYNETHLVNAQITEKYFS